ncbi:hypothetical protein AMTRI_Chr08g209540 [Amborella trichopoda]
MAHLGGGAEAHSRFKQYDYRANSNMVLTTDNKPRETHELTGELESLYGKIDPRTFGDSAARGKPPELEEKLKKLREESPKRRRLEKECVLSLSEDGIYQPKTKDTRAAYEILLSLIQQLFGGQPQEIIRGAADEVVSVLKNEKIKDPDKKEEIEKLLNPMAPQIFTNLVLVGKLITDYHDGDETGVGSGGDGGALDDNIGVAVEFEEDEEEEESDLEQVREETDNEEEDDGEKDNDTSAMQMAGLDDDDVEEADEGLNVHDIDAYWIQRKITQAYTDIDSSTARSSLKRSLKRDVENRLVTLLDYDKFNLVKLLFRNRPKVVWCTRLARAEGQKQRKSIEEEMMDGGPGLVILEQLHATRATAKEQQKNLEKSIRDEVQRLKDDGDRERRLERDGFPVENSWLKGQRQLLDLESLAFQRGGLLLLMANKKCDLPTGSYRTPKKGYEEVHVPALKPTHMIPGEELIKISVLPEWAQPAFSDMKQLNQVQSRVYETALFTPENILLCAPTGAGKTNVAMLAILQHIGLHRNADGSFDKSSYKIVYVAPMKALVAEVVGNLSKRLQSHGTLSRQQIEETQIIVTTPEKWDIITRKSGDGMYTQLVKLLIIDEIHLLHDNRGPVLESIVSRTVRQIETTKEHIPLFLRVHKDKGIFHFLNGYRPCALAQQYIGITVRKPLQRLQLMNDICYKKVEAIAGKHQVLIFVHSRKETVKTARAIRDRALEDSASREILWCEAENVKSTDLKDLLPHGFITHHAGMTRVDRTVVEGLFSDGNIQVLVSIATLAWGVNLPVHTVIIKGTQIYNPEKWAWTELSPLDVNQMLGRAGRPQYDTYGEGIILTGHSELQYYLSLMNEQLPIESQFMSKLADQLNAEIVLGTVQNARDACTWLGYTYLYIRMIWNPVLYGLTADAIENDKTLEEKSGYFQVTDLGRIASYYYISHRTISIYNEHLKPTMEFKYVIVRQDEKMELAKLLDCVPIPVKESLEEPSAKINVLLQACICQLKLEGLSLASDMIVLKRGWTQLAEKALNLCKMVGKCMWRAQTPLRQFKGIPNDILMKIEKKDLAWERYYDLSSQEIGELVRFPKMGITLHKLIHQFPKLNLAANVQPITHTVLRVELSITPDFQWDEKVHGYVEPFWVIVEDHDGEYILHHEYFMLKMQYIDEDHTLNFTYFICVVSDKWLGSQTVLPVSFRHLILPEKYPPPTELLDLQPLPHFNSIQTQVFTVLYNSDDNVLVAAPTCSGKTMCAEFALLRNHHKGPDSIMRVVYIAPMEALAEERYRDWEQKFGKGLGLRVVKLTGETATYLKLLEKAQIIISTPKKWDALSRRWKQWKHVQQVSLFIVDELHLIGGQGGPVLEVIISRMRYISSQVENKIRIVALSTSLANAKILENGLEPTLMIHIQGVDIANFKARMQAMTRPTYTAIVQHAKGEMPALVYVPARKHARLTAHDLVTYANAKSGEKSSFLLQPKEVLEPCISRVSEPALCTALRHGVGYIHEGLSSIDQDVVSHLFSAGCIQVCVSSSSMCWGTPLLAHLVVVMGTQYYDGRENVHTDYPITDLLQMMGNANRPLKDISGKCVILCHAPRKEYYKKFVYEFFPVESHLQHFLHDNLNAEVVVGTIKRKQDAVDHLTWTFMYRRLSQNPNYYNLRRVSRRHHSDHLSELVENALANLDASNCASFYSISYTTTERFSSLLTAKTKLKGLIEILASAPEYTDLPIRPGEEEMIRKLINHQRFSAHFSRHTVVGNLAADQREVLLSANRLLQVMVDVISTDGWLVLTLSAMELSQMVTQGIWDKDTALLQLPHFTRALAKKCKENPGKSIETIFDLLEMEDEERRDLLQISDSQLLDISKLGNRFPNIDMSYEILEGEVVRAGENVTLQVTLQRDLDGRSKVGPVDAPGYSKSNEEGWWLVIGDFKLNQKSKVKLEFTALSEVGKKEYILYFMCDSYLRCDQEYNFTVDVKEAMDEDGDGNERLAS